MSAHTPGPEFGFEFTRNGLTLRVVESLEREDPRETPRWICQEVGTSMTGKMGARVAMSAAEIFATCSCGKSHQPVAAYGGWCCPDALAQARGAR